MCSFPKTDTESQQTGADGPTMHVSFFFFCLISFSPFTFANCQCDGMNIKRKREKSMRAGRRGSCRSSPHGRSNSGANLPDVLINWTKRLIIQIVPPQESPKLRHTSIIKGAESSG